MRGGFGKVLEGNSSFDFLAGELSLGRVLEMKKLVIFEKMDIHSRESLYGMKLQEERMVRLRGSLQQDRELLRRRTWQQRST